MTKLIVRSLLAAAFVAGVAVPSHAEVRVTMQNGRVSLVAKDETLRQILAEWARAGQAQTIFQEKVALIECPTNTREFAKLYKVWGLHPPTEAFPAATRPARGPVADLTPFQKAGAVAVILAWTDISDANAADQYTPFSRPLQNIPALYVGREIGARLRALAARGAKATVVLEADIVPDTPTDTLIAFLPGTSRDEIIILNTHTDGPNATEENGAIGIVALAKYFSRLPLHDRRRTIVCPLTTGHFAGPWVPSMRGVIARSASRPPTMRRRTGRRSVRCACSRRADESEVTKAAASTRRKPGRELARQQRKDSIEQFQKGGRQDLVDKEGAEIVILERYLPPSADPAIVERAVAEAIAETGATSPKDMGRVMKAAMAKLAGQTIDGKAVNELVRARLGGA
jgi:hypothetical protein